MWQKRGLNQSRQAERNLITKREMRSQLYSNWPQIEECKAILPKVNQIIKINIQENSFSTRE